jgi:hypothetical protein
MTNFFYNLPIWLSTLLVLAIAVSGGIGTSLGMRRLFRLNPTNEERDVAINFMQVVATYVGIMIAFAGVQVWQDYIAAEDSIAHEAATATELYKDFAIFGPQTHAARGALRNYVRSVTTDEWPLLRSGSGSGATEGALLNLFNEIGKLDPNDNRTGAIYQQMLQKADDLTDLRRYRIVESESGIPLILWIVGLVGSLLTVSYASVITPSRLNVAMVGGIAFALGLLFVFMVTVDFPFKGEFSVSNRLLLNLGSEFNRLDRIEWKGG